MLKTYRAAPSLRSHALNALLKLTSKQTPRTEATEARCRAYIDGMAKTNSQPYPSPAKLVAARWRRTAPAGCRPSPGGGGRGRASRCWSTCTAAPT